MTRHASAEKYSRGNAVANILAGSWRLSPPRLNIEREEFKGTVPLLLNSGAGALAWWKLKQSPLPVSRETRASLKNVRQIYGLQSVIQERQLTQVLRFCNGLGINALIIKGWAIAKQYPNSGMRPAGDIDLCVATARISELKQKLATTPVTDCAIDLDHTEITQFGGMDFDELWEHSVCEEVNGTPIRMPCPEDHLRILCMHALKHGAWRPLWLCDIAVALESRPEIFDWDRCLGRDRKHSWWIICTLALANQLLGADITGTPAMEAVGKLPPWMVNAVLERWDSCDSPVLPRFASQLQNSSRDMRTILKIVRARWPNPIQATVDCNGAFTKRHRWRFQMQHFAERMWRILHPAEVSFSVKMKRLL
jgi:hypothetical protein